MSSETIVNRHKDTQLIIYCKINDIMSNLENKHYLLPNKMRRELGEPMGELIKGSITQTIPILIDRLYPHEDLLVAVGDVTAEILVEQGLEPDIIVTDGQTKREKLDEWKDWKNFEILTAKCPAAEITPEAWKVIQQAVNRAQNKPVHVKIYGEEDLLVLPLIVELPINSTIVYGQPNQGAVIRNIDEQAKRRAIDIIQRLTVKE